MKDRYGFDWSNIQGSPFWARPPIGRRMFFRHVASAVGGYFLLPSRPMETVAKAAVSPIGRAKNCIFILMAGAPSHVDTFDLKEGPWLPAAMNPTSYGDLRFPQGLMPKLAEQIDSLVLLRSVRAWALVHGLSQTWVQIGRNPTAAMSKIAPHIGSVASIELSPQNQDQTLPAFMSLNLASGIGSGYLPPANAPFFISPNGGGLPNTLHRDGPARFETRSGLLQDLDGAERASGDLGGGAVEMAQFAQNARRLMYNPDVDRIFTFDAAERQRYGNSAFGNSCITARNMLRARMGTRFIQITVGSWDNHTNIYGSGHNPSNPNSLAHQYDSGLGALIGDLKNEGLLDETLIVSLGEFGRTVGRPNGANGRDHFLQQSVLFAGAGLAGGRAVGATDDEGRNTTETGWSRDRDVRPEDIEATIYSALGINWTTVRRDDPLGRGFEYVPFADRDLYGPVHEIWG